MDDKRQARVLAQMCGVVDNIAYYAPEIREFRQAGISHYWDAYMAYRSAPMGQVPAAVVTATFYNFAPRMVERAIPVVWESVSPAEAMAMRDDMIDRALRRGLGDLISDPTLARAASLAREAIEGCDVAGRPLFAAHSALCWPEPAHMALYHACTRWREQRGDSHVIALSVAEIDGIECHVLLSGKGVATATVIDKIRGGTASEWDAAQERLVARGLFNADGTFGADGRDYRIEIEARTDRLARAPRERLGRARCDELIGLLEPVVNRLIDTGAVAPSWPPSSRFLQGIR